MIKLSRRLRCGNHKQRRAYRALITVGRSVHNHYIVGAFAFRCKCGRTAAIKVYCFNASCIEHYLCNFNGATTGGKRFLPSIKNHHNNSAIICNTHAGSCNTLGIIVGCVIDNNLTIFNKAWTRSNRFFYVAPVCVPFFASTNDRCAIIKNSEEIFVTQSMIFNAFHNKSTGRCSVAHIIKVSVCTDNCTVIRNVVFCIIGIGVLCFGRLHLVGNARHFPYRAVIAVVVCINIYVTAGNIGCSNVINYLFIIVRQRHFNFLGNTGRNNGRCAGKHLVIGVVEPIFCRQVKIIGKSIAARSAKVGVYAVWQIRPFKSSYSFVAIISTVNRFSDFALFRNAKAIFKEELRSYTVIKVCGEVVFHNSAYTAASLELFENIKCVQISVKVKYAKRVYIIARVVVEEILIVIRSYFFCHFLDSAGNPGVSCQLYKVTNVTRPASEVGSALVFGMVSHIHCSEHMLKINFVAVRQGEILQVTQSCHRSSVCSILLCNIACKSSVFRSAERGPCAGSILFNAAADIVYNKRNRILILVLTRIRFCIAFK